MKERDEVKLKSKILQFVKANMVFSGTAEEVYAEVYKIVDGIFEICLSCTNPK